MLEELPVATWDLIAAKAKRLPADKQLEALDFVEFLSRRAPTDPLAE